MWWLIPGIIAALTYMGVIQYMRYTHHTHHSPIPITSYRVIGKQLALYELPFMTRTATTFGFFYTYGVPSISSLLARTGEFTCSGQKRYDDTELLLAEMVERCLCPSRVNAASDRLNAIHAKYAISTEDYLFTLALFVVPPVQWCDRWGWRSFSPKEADALALAWAEVGAGMGIPADQIPLGYDAFLKLYHQVILPDSETCRIAYAESNAVVTHASIDVVASWTHPWVVWVLGKERIHAWIASVCAAFMPPHLVSALGLSRPHWALVYALQTLLTIRKYVVRFLLPPRPSWWPCLVTPGPLDDTALDTSFPSAPHSKTYQTSGYSIPSLGPSFLPPTPLPPSVSAPGPHSTMHSTNLQHWLSLRDAWLLQQASS